MRVLDAGLLVMWMCVSMSVVVRGGIASDGGAEKDLDPQQFVVKTQIYTADDDGDVGGGQPGGQAGGVGSSNGGGKGSDGKACDKNGGKNCPVDPMKILEEKWGMMFNYYDINRDGQVNKADFDIMDKRLRNSTLFKSVAKKVTRLSQAIDDNAEKILKRINEKKMTKNATVKSMQLHRKEGKLQVSVFRGALYDILSPFGELSRETFVAFEQALYTMDAVTANRAFDAIAGSGRSSVLKMHYIAAYHRYFTDPSADVDRFPLHGMEGDI